jgi:hypothetical protein
MYLTAPISWSEGNARQAPTIHNRRQARGGDLIDSWKEGCRRSRRRKSGSQKRSSNFVDCLILDSRSVVGGQFRRA